jgi:hypothetical protein
MSEAETAAPEDERAAARRAGEPENWDGQVLGELMRTSQGRRFVERFLDFTGCGQRIYQGDGDALGAMWRDGLAETGRFWEQLLLHHCPDLYLRMVTERKAGIERALKRTARQEERRNPKEAAPLTVTGVEELADEQRRQAEVDAEQAARAANSAKRKSKKD